MFRRLEASLPPDMVFPTDLEKLGYYINEVGEIRKIAAPTEYFQYYISNNARVNEMHREAFNECIRELILSRASCSAVKRLYLPQLTIEKPPEPAVPILITSPNSLRRSKHVIVVVNNPMQDLGVWSYHVLSNQGGLVPGSILSIVEDMAVACKRGQNRTLTNSLSDSGQPAYLESMEEASVLDELSGLVMLNPGQLMYSHRSNKTVTAASWSAMPRPSAVHPGIVFDAAKNTIPGHHTLQEHLQSVFCNVINNPDYVSPDAYLYFVGIDDGGNELVSFLNDKWDIYKSRTASLALTEPTFDVERTVTNTEFAEFMINRARAWKVHDGQVNTPIAMPKMKPQELQRLSESEHLAPAPLKNDITAKKDGCISGESKSSTSSTSGNPALRLYLDKLRDNGVGECALETSISEKDVFIDAEEAVAKTVEAMQHREHVSRRRASVIGRAKLGQVPLDVDRPGMVQDNRDGEETKDPATEDVTRLLTKTEPQWGDNKESDHAQPVSCPTFSSGEPHFRDGVFPAVCKEVLAFFREVSRNTEHYLNPSFEMAAMTRDEVEVDGSVISSDIQQEMDSKIRVVDMSQVLDTHNPIDVEHPPRTTSSTHMGLTVPESEVSILGHEQTSPSLKDGEALDPTIKIAGQTISKHLAERAGL